MPAKKKPESQAEQSKRFRREAGRLIKSGDLDPAEGEAALDKLVRRSAPKR